MAQDGRPVHGGRNALILAALLCGRRHGATWPFDSSAPLDDLAPRSVLELLPHTATDVAQHSLGELGEIDTLLVWRREQFSAALNALRDVLLAERALDASRSVAKTEPEHAAGRA